jgi:rhamnosyltransferase subunit B
MDYVFYSLGTVGDALPFLKLAATLNSKGVSAAFVGNEKFSSLASSFGVEFHAVSSRLDYEKTYNNPLTWSPSYNQNHYNQFHLPAIKPTFKAIEQFVKDGQKPFVVFQDTLSGARMACVEFDLPFCQVALAPYSIGSCLSPSYPMRRMVPEASWSQIIPKLIQKSAKDTHERLVLPFINPVRSELGIKEWEQQDLPTLEQSPHVIALFPEWFKQRPADWPPQTRNTGFLLSNLAMGFNRERLDDFILTHGAPITFSFGTGIPVTPHLIEKVARICADVGRPGVLVAHAESERQIDDFASPLLVLPVAQFDYLFPRSSLVVHHGGIGTCAQALAAGVPQLITPYSFDQPDNAYQLWQLGTSNSIDILNAPLSDISSMIGELSSSGEVAGKAKQYAQITVDATESSADYLLAARRH